MSAVGSGALLCQALDARALRVLAPMTTPMVRATALMVVAAGSAHAQPHTGPRVCTDGHGTGRWGVAAGGDAAAAVVGDDLTGAIWMKGDQAATVPREVGDHKRLVVFIADLQLSNSTGGDRREVSQRSGSRAQVVCHNRLRAQLPSFCSEAECGSPSSRHHRHHAAAGQRIGQRIVQCLDRP